MGTSVGSHVHVALDVFRGTMHCGAYIVVRYHISKLFIFAGFTKSCSSPGCSLLASAVHHGLMLCRVLWHDMAV
jgi:hypothetical protein